MRILITGCTAKQVSSSVNNRIPTFAGLLVETLVSRGIDVTWGKPDLDDMNEAFVSSFDSVLVGITSPASLSANYIYPALSVADYANKAGILSFFIDAPEPHRIWAGIMSTIQSQDGLKKDFYARRKSFRQGTSPGTYDRLYAFLEALRGSPWPLTVAPTLPWTKEGFLSRHIPNLYDENVLGLALDQQIVVPTTDSTPEEIRWLLDDPATPWSKEIVKTLSLSAAPLRESKHDRLESLVSRLSSAVGTLVSTYRSNDPWWSPAVYTSLLCGSPVVSDWRLTADLGACWSGLPVSLEGASLEERSLIAKQQKESYEDSLEPIEKQVPLLLDALSSSKKI